MSGTENDGVELEKLAKPSIRLIAALSTRGDSMQHAARFHEYHGDSQK